VQNFYVAEYRVILVYWHACKSF